MWLIILSDCHTIQLRLGLFSFFFLSGVFSTTYRESRSMSSGLDIPSGRTRGMAATHVLNKSILGFLSPLKRSNFKFNCKSLIRVDQTVKCKLIKHCVKNRS